VNPPNPQTCDSSTILIDSSIIQKLGGAFDELPLQSASLTINNLILFSTVRALPAGAKPSLTWNAPAAIVYGTALGASQLNAMPNIAGNLTYTSAAGTVLPAGNHTLSATFTPTDTGNYTSANASVPLVVGPPVVTPQTPAPSSGGGGAAPEKSKKGKKAKTSSPKKSSSKKAKKK